MSHTFHPSILREYDIRGIVGDTLTETDAYALGLRLQHWNGLDISSFDRRVFAS